MSDMINLKLNEQEGWLVAALLDDGLRRSHDALYARHVIRKDGQPNKARKYLSEYEEGELEDYRRLQGLKRELEGHLA